jgi:uncharacterized protein (TIGR03435 family)
LSFYGGPGSQDPGHLNINGASLSDLILLAYNITPYELSGPEWLKTEHFDVFAKLPTGENTRPNMLLMLQSLLKTRFKLAMYKEPREMPAYDLVITKDGPKLRESSGAKAPIAEERSPRPLRIRDRAINDTGYPILPDETTTDRAVVRGHVTARFISIDMAAFMNQLRPFVDRPVIDRTGLIGRYDILLHYLQGSALRDGSTPTVLEAIQSQLGLKLESNRELVSIWVVDSVEKAPSGY